MSFPLDTTCGCHNLVKFGRLAVELQILLAIVIVLNRFKLSLRRLVSPFLLRVGQ